MKNIPVSEEFGHTEPCDGGGAEAKGASIVQDEESKEEPNSAL